MASEASEARAAANHMGPTVDTYLWSMSGIMLRKDFFSLHDCKYDVVEC